MGNGALMDSTIAIIGILAVIVFLVLYLWLPEWLRNRRMRKELQERRVPKPGPWPPPPVESIGDAHEVAQKKAAAKPPPKKP
jgi:hypothetical protein